MVVPTSLRRAAASSWLGLVEAQLCDLRELPSRRNERELGSGRSSGFAVTRDLEGW